MLAEFDASLASQPSLSGEKHGLLDFATLPFVRQFRIADPVGSMHRLATSASLAAGLSGKPICVM